MHTAALRFGLFALFTIAPASYTARGNDEPMKIASELNQFTFDLYRTVSNEKGNLFCSPYSVSTALTLVYAGARGDTEREMAAALHFSEPQDQLHADVSKL